MRATLWGAAFAIALSIAACGGSKPPDRFPLVWLGVDDSLTAGVEVSNAFTSTPLTLRVRDVRSDPSAIGVFKDDGHVVRTTGSVEKHVAQRVHDMLTRAGARLNEPALASVNLELLEYNVVEGGIYKGVVRLRVSVQRGSGPAWQALYEGKSRRWGRSHSPDNYNETLSNALVDALRKLVRDETFANALASVQSSEAPSPEAPAPVSSAASP